MAFDPPRMLFTKHAIAKESGPLAAFVQWTEAVLSL